MKGVTSEVIAEVRGRAGILEVVSETVVLKRAGKEYKGLCPFHHEKTPSFHVNPEKGIFKCFGCGEGGDVFAFVQRSKGLDFLDSVRELAHRYGVRLVESTEDRENYDKRTRILMLYQQAAEFYSRLLEDPAEGLVARQYLKARGICDETAERFGLGYAPGSWDGLLRYLTGANKIGGAVLEEAGLVRRRQDSSSYFDLFRHRLMVPICDDQGRVIAFGGRTLGDDQVKYLNSPESPIYTKGEHLFGFHLAKDAIKTKDQVVVVEGYFDAITAHQYGFDQTVAALGTALTERQAKQLVRYTESKRVFLCFDADAAGERAMERGVETLNQIAEGVGIELRVISVPGGKDPDECLRSQESGAGPEGFAAALETAPVLCDFQLERAIKDTDLSTHTGRIDAAGRIVPILAGIRNAVARGEYIRQWALRIRIREEELLADVGQFRRQAGLRLAPAARPGSASRAAATLQSGHLEAERQLLALYLTSRDDYERVNAALADEHFVDPVHQRIKEAIEGIGSHFGTVDDLQARLWDRLGPDQAASRALSDIVLKVDELRKQKTPGEVTLRGGRARILQERVVRELERLKQLAMSVSSDDERNAIDGKIIQLKRLITNLLPTAQSESDLDDIKRRIEETLAAEGQPTALETTA